MMKHYVLLCFGTWHGISIQSPVCTTSLSSIVSLGCLMPLALIGPTGKNKSSHRNKVVLSQEQHILMVSKECSGPEMDTCGCCWRAINSVHFEPEQSVICWLRDCWEAMDTKLFVLLPEMFPFPLFETATATSYSRLWSLSEQREHSCSNWNFFSWAAVWSDYSV